MNISVALPHVLTRILSELSCIHDELRGGGGYAHPFLVHEWKRMHGRAFGVGADLGKARRHLLDGPTLAAPCRTPHDCASWGPIGAVGPWKIRWRPSAAAAASAAMSEADAVGMGGKRMWWKTWRGRSRSGRCCCDGVGSRNRTEKWMRRRRLHGFHGKMAVAPASKKRLIRFLQRGC